MSSFEELTRSSTRGSYRMVDAYRPTAQHILDERRRTALAEIDDAPLSWTHAKVCIVAGVGFFTDAYDIFAINIASTMLGYVYGSQTTTDDYYLKLNPSQDLGVKIATPVGILIGQLFFGWLADIVGRKKMYGVELTIIIVATFSQALAAEGNAIHIIGVLVVWRFVMGIGIGGDYPLSAVITSEFSATKFRGRMMTAVMSAQGLGNFAAALVGLTVVAAYKNSIGESPDCINNPNSNSQNLQRIDDVWRILIGLGCVPGVIGLFFRLTIPETPRFTMDIERNIDRATHDITNVAGGQNEQVDEEAFIQRIDAPRASWSDFCAHFGQWRNFKILLGASYSWFALDIAFYGLGLNTNTIFSTILSAIHFDIPPSPTKCTAYTSLHNLCVGNLILSVAGLLPGYWVAFLFIDKWGRKPIQLMGFSILTLLLIILGVYYDKLPSTPQLQITTLQKAYFSLYCLANFFQNFGPNVTTFIVPGEAFPTRYRSTAYGISAACGKLGAIVAQVVFWQLTRNHADDQNKRVGHTLIIFAVFMLTGVGSTLLLPETKGRTLEELSNEKQEGFVRGVKNSKLHVRQEPYGPIQLAEF
ncbi:hypothetical protein D9619_011201 [Psilocybe cf. subviscida]|uniref:Major facilitator superfamily (MFS) profile domain-containing protein n=1 Tax=Psilocybe cf. subviscida TaxID=2480587 RepID=A0A8H5F526_9AGAR|nr:hypothetical protein D9619_011201 [Psilocybe cf. subviscida]